MAYAGAIAASAPLRLARGLARALNEATDGALAAARPIAGHPSACDILAVAILTGLAAFSIFHGFDLSRLMTGDALFPVQVQYFPALEYRPPPSNNLFPDVALHLLIGSLITDPLAQKLIAGWTLFAAMFAAIGLFKGPLAALLVFATLALGGFGFVDTTAHYTLALTVLCYQLCDRRWLQNTVLIVIVFSDLLVLLPLAVLVIAPGQEKRLAERIAIIAVAAIANTLYSEFSEALMKLALVLPLFGMAVLVARAFGLLRLFSIAMVVVLPVMSLAGLTEPRYALPVAASFLVGLFATRSPVFDWRFVTTPAAALAIFALTFDAARLNLEARQYDCLLATLDARGIDVIAADHWTSKPLYFAARERGQALTITQTDFAEGDTSLWMAPYDFTGVPTRHALKSHTVCSTIAVTEQFCSQETVAPVERSEKLCEGLELFTYAEPVPQHHRPRPQSKLESVRRHLAAYMAKVGIHLD